MQVTLNRFVFGFTWIVLTAVTAQAADPEKPRLDAYGDPLPAEALLRLGTTRFRLPGHSECRVTISPDGKSILAAIDSGLFLYDAASGQLQKRIESKLLLDFNTRPPFQLANPIFSPDGKKIGICSSRGFEIYDCDSGRLLGCVKGEAGSENTASFSRDGQLLALGVERASKEHPAVTVWDASTLKQLHAFTVPNGERVKVALSGDGRRLATWGQSYDWGGPSESTRTALLWDATTGKELKKFVVVSDWLKDVALSPDGKTLATVDDSDQLTMFDATTGEKRYQIGIRRKARGLQFSPDGKQLVAIVGDQDIQGWETATGKRLFTTKSPARFSVSPERLSVIRVLADNRVAAVSQDRLALHVWDAPSSRLRSPKDAHVCALETLTFRADGKTLLSSARDGVRIWDTATAQHLQHLSLIVEQDNWMDRRKFGLSPGGKYVLCWDGRWRSMWLAETDTEQEVFGVPDAGIFNEGETYAFSADGGTLAFHTKQQYAVRVRDIRTGRDAALLKLSHRQLALLLSPDGKCVLLVTMPPDVDKQEMPCELTLYDSATGKERWRTTCERERLDRVAFSPTGEFFATGGPAGIGLRDAATGHLVSTFEKVPQRRVTVLTFSPDGRTLAVVFQEENDAPGPVTLLETTTGKCRATFSGQGGATRCLAFSPDGLRLASGATDTTILLWDLTGQLAPAVRALSKPTPAAFDALWDELADADAEKAYRRIQHLTQFPAESVALVKKKLSPARAPKVTIAEIEQWIADLEHNEFARREQAQQALAALGKTADPALTKALQGKPTPEQKRRLEELVEAMEQKRPRPEMVRPTRALELLERVGTTEAKQLLEELAKGDPDAPLTQDAKATLRRQANRANP